MSKVTMETGYEVYDDQRGLTIVTVPLEEAQSALGVALQLFEKIRATKIVLQSPNECHLMIEIIKVYWKQEGGGYPLQVHFDIPVLGLDGFGDQIHVSLSMGALLQNQTNKDVEIFVALQKPPSQRDAEPVVFHNKDISTSGGRGVVVTALLQALCSAIDCHQAKIEELIVGWERIKQAM